MCHRDSLLLLNLPLARRQPARASSPRATDRSVGPSGRHMPSATPFMPRCAKRLPPVCPAPVTESTQEICRKPAGSDGNGQQEVPYQVPTSASECAICFDLLWSTGFMRFNRTENALSKIRITTHQRAPITRGPSTILSACRGIVLEILVGQNGFRWDPEDSAHNGSDRDPCGSGPDCPKPHRAWAVICERSDRGRPPRQNQVTTAR